MKYTIVRLSINWGVIFLEVHSGNLSTEQISQFNDKELLIIRTANEEWT